MPTMALVSGSRGSYANPSPAKFALSSLLTISEEVEVLPHDELALAINPFKVVPRQPQEPSPWWTKLFESDAGTVSPFSLTCRVA